MPYDVRAVANYFLDRADEAGRELEHMALQKLVYIAHGWHLAITGEPLIYERAEAWPYGPVIPELYYELMQYGRRPIRKRLSVVDLDTFERVPASVDAADAPPTPQTAEILDRVWANYGQLDANQLSALAHDPGTPWDAIAKQHGTDKPRGIVIPNDLLSEYYGALADERRKARVG